MRTLHEVLSSKRTCSGCGKTVVEIESLNGQSIICEPFPITGSRSSDRLVLPEGRFADLSGEQYRREAIPSDVVVFLLHAGRCSLTFRRPGDARKVNQYATR